ncbi:hypothetical protein AX774_g2516 [Zancudomyces culisetae]|uniref:Uncharacterized protein n=1 Tax=Zancudomyces culisetae TaxID=1213189 RepID=A0A1R1PSR6_ZANCU|nr:hypothetical protein AX774_g2516 [Zancudomyces culisetae]|eukprot:OMH83969.1 hypothetical protein AX774_g2516 [Zancudomyces culisetae]
MIETYGREFENDDYSTISALLEKSVRAVTIGNTKTACNRIFQAIQKFEESDNVFINGNTNENRLVTNQVEDETRAIRSGIWKVYLLILGSIIENIRDNDDLEFVFTENSQKSIGKAGQRLGSFSRLNEFPRSVSALQMQIEIAYGSFGSIEIDVFEAM